MIKTIRRTALAIAVLSTSVTFACDVDGTTGIMPENDMYISTSQKSENGMTEEIFNLIMDRAIEHYEPIVEAKKKKLVFHRKWEDGTVNAYANQSGKTWNVRMFGGLARHNLVSADGFALVVCHELGHHLAGAPKIKRFFSSSWASNEGQSDYWASLKCFRRMFQDDNNLEVVSNLNVDEEVAKKCDSSWSDANDNALCKRMGTAAKGLATLLNGGKSVSFTTPDSTIVRKTNDKHPAGQCRLDTYFQGTLCEMDFSDNVSDKDATQGTCNRVDRHEIGNRPLCWYKPKKI